MRLKRYINFAILDKDNNVVPVEDSIEWGKQFAAHPEKRQVARDLVEGMLVSTVFLGVNHGWDKRDLWFETMVFRQLAKPDAFGTLGKDYYQERYETYAEALAGHARIVAHVKGGEIGE